MLRALYAAISLRFGKFLISDPGVSLFGILPLRSSFIRISFRITLFPFKPFFFEIPMMPLLRTTVMIAMIANYIF